MTLLRLLDLLLGIVVAALILGRAFTVTASRS